jgi:hypothetical protein
MFHSRLEVEDILKEVLRSGDDGDAGVAPEGDERALAAEDVEAGRRRGA